MARSVSSSRSDDDGQTKKRDKLKKSPLKSRPARRESSSGSSASSSDSSSADSDSRKRRSSLSRRAAGRHDDRRRDKDRSSRHRKESPAKRNSSDRHRNDSGGRRDRESRRRSPSRDKEAHRSGSRNRSKVSDSRSRNRSDKRSRSKSVHRSRNRSGRRSRSRTDRRSRRSRSRESRRIGQTARERFEAVVGYAEPPPRVERWSGSRFSSWNRFSPRRRRSPERRRDRRSRSRSNIRNRRSLSGHKNRSRSRSARRRRRSSSSSSSTSSSGSSSSSRGSRTPGRKSSNETVSPKKKDVDEAKPSKESVVEKSETSTKKPIDKKDCDEKPIVENRDRDKSSVPSHEHEKNNSELTVPEGENSTTILQSPGTAQIPDSPTAGKNIANNFDESVRRDSTEEHQVSNDVPVTAINDTNKTVGQNREEKQAPKVSSGDPCVSESEKEGAKSHDQHAMSPGESESNHEGDMEKSSGLKNNDQSNDNNSSSEVEDRSREHGAKGRVRRHCSSSNESKSPDLPVRAEESVLEENVKQAPARKKRKSKSPFSEKEVPADSSRQENSDTPKELPRKIQSRDDVKNSLDEGLSNMEYDTEQKSLRTDYRDRHQINRDAAELNKGISIEQKHLSQDYKKNNSLPSGESRTHETYVSEQPGEETSGELVKDVPVDAGRKQLSDRASRKLSGDILSSDSDDCATEKDRRINDQKKTEKKNARSDDEIIESDSDQAAHAEKKKKKERKVKEKKKTSSASSDSDGSDSDELVVPDKKTRKHSRKKNKKKSSKKFDDDSNSNSDDPRKKRSKRKLEKSSRPKKGHHNKKLLAEREEGALTESEEEDEKELMRKKRRIEEQLKREMEIKDKEEKRKVEEKLAEVREFEKRHAEVKERENRYRPERTDCADEVIGERYWGAKDLKGGSKLSKNSDTYWNKYADELGIQIEEPRRRENRERDRENRKRDDKEPEAKRSKLEDLAKGGTQEGTQPASAIKKPVVDPLQTRTGGAYIPPAKLRMMQAEITDKSSAAFQRLAWEALKKSINGLVNKVNVSNIGIIVRELLKENVVRGRGILCRSLMQAQAFSLTFTHVYAALVAVLNSKFPQIGLLLLNRLIIQFRRGIKRNDKSICLSSSRFIAHLMNQQVAHEVVALEILTFLLEKVQDVTDTTEVGDKSRNNCAELAAAFLRECGQKLQDLSPRCSISIFGSVKDAINEGKLDDRVKYMFEAIWSEGRNNFKDNPAVIEELDLVEEDDQITHIVELDGKLDSDDILNVFRHDPEYEANEEKYKEIQASILGESDDEEGSDDDGSESSDSESDDGDQSKTKEGQEIIDQTEGNMLAFRRTIYLTLRSSLTVDEATHKILKGEIKPGWEMELGNMILDCCAQERTFIKFFALIAQRFCNINRVYRDCFQEIFKTAYETCHRLDIDKLRNVVRLFAHLFVTDAISWEVFSVVLLNADNTTSSSRVFLKILFQEMAEFLGLSKLNDRLRDPTLSGAFEGLLPRDNPRNTRFAINFFTSIGLGGLTDGLREFLRLQPKPTAIVAPVVQKGDGSGSSSSSGSGSSSSSSSESSDETSESSSSSNSESSDSSSSSSSDSSSSDSDSSSSSSDDDRKRSHKKKAGARNRDRRTSSAAAPPDTPSHRREDSSRRDDSNRRRDESSRRHEEEGRQREESGRRRVEGSGRRGDEDTIRRHSGRNASEVRETEEQRGESRRRVSDSKRRSEHDKRAPRDGSRTRHRR